MTFNEQFAQQKIPEWLGHYIDYDMLSGMIEDFQEKEKKGVMCQLPGIYYYSLALQQPIALSFDVAKKNKKTISAMAASKKLQ